MSPRFISFVRASVIISTVVGTAFLVAGDGGTLLTTILSGAGSGYVAWFLADMILPE